MEAAALKKLAEAEAATAVKELDEEAARRQSAVFVIPLNSAPPPPEFMAPTGGAGDEHPIMGRDDGNVVMPDVIVPPPPPSEEARDKQPADPPTPPGYLGKAASAPRPLETGAASSSIPDAEATNAAPAGWIHGGGTGALN